MNEEAACVQDEAQAWVQDLLNREVNGRTFTNKEMASRTVGAAILFSSMAKSAQLSEEDAIALVRSYLQRVQLLRKKPAHA